MSRSSKNRIHGGRAVAAGIVVAVALSGCVSLFIPSRGGDTSTPTGEKVSADLEPFYSQVLEWSACEQSFQCATAEAPLDWADPGRDSIDLALIRSSASGDPAGSLLVNPGGPGGSGFDFVRDGLDVAVSARLKDRFDVVGFDPRGVNKSSAVSCYRDPDELDAYLFDLLPGEPGSEEYIAAREQRSADFGKDCESNTGELLGYVDTVSAARDLDLLRAILGDTSLNYLGYSYGTRLGATYAELYPDKVGRLVLDGAIDPTADAFEGTLTQAGGFENALRAYLADCATGDECPFTGTVDESMAEIRALLDSLDASPLRATDGRLLGSDTMFYAIIYPLYSASTWPYLNELFSTVMQGQAQIAFTLADAYYDRDEDGEYLSNSTEAFIAISCIDDDRTAVTDSLDEEAEELSRVAPTLGPELAWDTTSCAEWPARATEAVGPLRAEGSVPILVIGTTGDPATPYIWAEALASQLENAQLITYDGEGHTAYNKSNSCVNDAVDDYFVDGVVPSSDPLC